MSLAFLNHILPADGVYAGWCKREASIRQKLFLTTADLWAWIARQNSLGLHAYHACASFKDAGAPRPRGHANALGARALWSEADSRLTHADAPYADAREIVPAVKRFCATLELPAPVWVFTGSGAHWYWPFLETLEPEAWTKLANALKRAYVEHNVHADPARTADISSVLRTPGTLHWSISTTVVCPQLVGPYDVGIFEAALEPYHDAGRPHKPNTVRAGSFTSLAANIYEENSADPERIADACGQLARMRATRGTLPEPVWRACLGVLVHCRDGEKYGHDWSTGDDRYDPAETAGKMQRWRAAANGPTTCTYFAGINAAGCVGCPHRGKITSPIELGRIHAAHAIEGSVGPEVNELTDIALPENYGWGQHGELVQVSEKNGVKDEFVIAKHPIHLAHVYETETTRQMHYGFRQRFPATGWRDIVLPAEVAVGSSSSGKLAAGGAAIRQSKEFATYARHALELKMNNKPEVCYEQYGWKGEGAFLYGDKLYHADGKVTAAIGTSDLMTRAQWLGPSPFGSLAKWTSAANKIIRDKPLYQITVCAGFASTLMPMVNDIEGGLLINDMSPASGKGKTVVLSVTASIWGEWRATEIKKTDTAVTRAMTCALLNCLPVCFDEIALLRDEKDPQALHEFVMMFSGGRDKMRATQGGQSIHHVASRWRTFCLGTSNHPLVDILRVLGPTAKGPLMRVAEFRIPYKADANPAEIEALRACCQENCGHAGAAWVKLIVQPKWQEYIRKNLAICTQYIWDKYKLPPEARFWVKGLGAIMVAGLVLQSAGILTVDPILMIDHAVDALMAEADWAEDYEPKYEVLHTNTPEAVELLNTYVNTHQDDILRVQKAWSPREPTLPPLYQPRRLLMRYETETGRLYITRTAFRHWVVNEGQPWTQTLESLREAGLLLHDNKKITLGAGTPLASGQVYCCEFDFHAPLASGRPQLVSASAGFAAEPPA